MAQKYSFWRLHRACIIYLAAASLLSAGFLVLQQLCMNHSSDSFVDSTCLSDSRARALVSVFLTASGFLLLKMVFAAANAYRVAQLPRGIEEGVYIAMTPTAPYRYQARAMATRWGLAIAVIIALQHAPGLIQPIANLGLTTISVYVRNNSTAQIIAGVGSYSLPAESKPLDTAVAAGVPVANIQVSFETKLGLFGAYSVLTQLRGFAGGQGSTRASDGSVTTPVVRANLVITTAINNVDASNAFRQTGLVATLTAICVDEPLVASLAKLQTSSSQSYNVSATGRQQTSIGTGNVTSVVVADVTSDVDSPTSVGFNMTYFMGACVNCKALLPTQALNGTLSSCTARASFRVQDYAFGVASGTVTRLGSPIGNDTAQLDPRLAGVLTAAFAAASFDATRISTDPLFLLSLMDLSINFPGGLFKSSASNLLYSTLCTALSQTLSALYAVADFDPEAEYDVYDIDDEVASGARDVPLYSLQLVTRVPTWTAAVLVGIVLGSMLVLGAWGMAWSHLSAINIKDATETTLMDSVDNNFIAKKRTAGASNDPDLQMVRAFSDDRGGMLLFARAAHDPEGKAQRIVLSNDPEVGWMPDKSVDYV